MTHQEPTSEPIEALLGRLTEAQQRNADAKIEVAGYLKDIESHLRVLKQVRDRLEKLPDACEDIEYLRDLTWACYYMLDILSKRMAAKDADLERELKEFRTAMTASGLEDKIHEIRIEQIQVTGEADDRAETRKKKRKRK